MAPETANTNKDQEPGSIADAVPANWVDRFAPAFTRPYLRLARADRPIGTWLLLWPCLWASALAASAAGSPLPNLWHMALFAIGALVMRGAGCTFNDLVDRDIDAQVARTRSRPIPSGQVSARNAAVFMVALSLIGFVVLLQFNGPTIWLGIASLGIVAAYPFMKRVTNWPQFVLGLAFNWGALLGWTAVFGSLSAAPALLYLGGIAWTIGYDTIYAHQDREDDALIGVKSTARLFGDNTHRWLRRFLIVAVSLMGAAVVLALVGRVNILALTVAFCGAWA
ncbi:MAG: 4-hydroxybenzoate octaprenyltransferase, partial [Pseudomonadota bacterium]